MKTSSLRTQSLILLTVAYLLIEAQALLFLMEIFRSPLSADEMGNYERFGYATFGLGATLLFFRATNRRFKKPHHAVAIVCILPLIYGVGVWSVYELVSRSHHLIPDDRRTSALHHSLNILNQHDNKPAWQRAWQFYLSPELNTSADDDAERFVERFPLSDTAIRALYIQSLNNVADFSYVYQRARARMIKSQWQALSEKAEIAARSEINDYQLANALQVTESTFFLRWANPSQWPSLFASSVFSSRAGSVLHIPAAAHIASGGAPRTREQLLKELITPHHAQAETKQRYVQKRLSDALKAPVNTANEWAEAMRLAYTNKLLYPFVETRDLPLIPWHDNQSPWNDEAYLFVIQQIAPVLFNGGKPVITLANVRDDDVRFKYVNNLRQGLHPALRTHWLAHRKDTLASLSTDPKAWQHIGLRTMNEDHLRISTVLPWLMLLSTIMLGVNLLMLAVQSRIAGTMALLSVGGLVATQPEWFSDLLLQVLLPISVDAPSIFVL